MLTATFVHAQGVGFDTERSLWRQGALDWRLFLEKYDDLKAPQAAKTLLRETALRSIEALENRNVAYFARNLMQREHWRALDSFDRIGFLDIETNGQRSGGCITVIGISKGDEDSYRAYVKHRDLDEFVDDCRNYDGFVTFFGGGFDIPVLVGQYPELTSVFKDRLHVDLCPALKRLGLSGGLKRIERQLGISRGPDTDGMDGMDAVRLWRAYRSGRHGAEDALRVLIEYNKEDVLNMRALLAWALPRLRLANGYDESRSYVPQEAR